MPYIKRELEETFLEASNSFKAVLVTGARQIGKSTMLKHLAKEEHRTVVTMDSEADRTLARKDPALFFQTYKPPILIDEVQKAPELFETIKIMCDESDAHGLFWLTGSQSKKLIDKASDSLAGRLAILKMYPFSARELSGHTDCGAIDFSFDALSERQKLFPANDIQTVFDFIWCGGMPDAQTLSEKMLSTYFDSYINTYLMRDAVDDNGIKDVEGFRKFLRACASFAAQLLNYNDLAVAADISPVTAKEWVKILQSMGIVTVLEPYSSNELKRMIKTPKLYFCDTGLCAYLSMWPSRDVLLSGAASGHYYENYVVMELIKNLTYNSPRSQVTFYRDRDSKEIDIIVEDAQCLHPLEIKKSTNPSDSEIRKFKLLTKTSMEIGSGGIICMCSKPFPIDGQNSLIPSNLL